MRMSEAATETREKKSNENEPISNLSLTHNTMVTLFFLFVL